MKVLDVGCGTGFVAEYMLPLLSQPKYVLNDISPNTLYQASKKLSEAGLDFIIADAEITNFNGVPYDLIISHLVFQWFDHLEKGIKNLWRQTNCLAFTILLKGTFSEWQTIYEQLGAISNINEFPSLNQVKSFCLNLPNANTSFSEQFMTEEFSNPLDFIKSLKGAQTSKARHNNTKLKTILSHFSGTIRANYNVLHCVIRRHNPS